MFLWDRSRNIWLNHISIFILSSIPKKTWTLLLIIKHWIVIQLKKQIFMPKVRSIWPLKLMNLSKWLNIGNQETEISSLCIEIKKIFLIIIDDLSCIIIDIGLLEKISNHFCSSFYYFDYGSEFLWIVSHLSIFFYMYCRKSRTFISLPQN